MSDRLSFVTQPTNVVQLFFKENHLAATSDESMEVIDLDPFLRPPENDTDIDLAKVTLENGFVVTPSIFNRIHRAVGISDGHPSSTLMLLYSHGWRPDNPKQKEGGLLEYFFEDIEALQWLLANGLTVQHQTLVQAAGKSSIDTMAILIGRWEDSDSPYWKNNALHSAAGARTGNKRHSELLSTEEDEERIAMMEYLINAGWQVNVKDTPSPSKLPLMPLGFPINYAIFAGAPKRVGILLKNGADPDLSGPHGSVRRIAAGLKARNVHSPFHDIIEQAAPQPVPRVN